MIQYVPSGMTLIPECPWIGCPLNGSDTPVGRSNDLPITLPMASIRLPVVNLPDTLRSAGAYAGASMNVSGGNVTCPARVAVNSFWAHAGAQTMTSAAAVAVANRISMPPFFMQTRLCDHFVKVA